MTLKFTATAANGDDMTGVLTDFAASIGLACLGRNFVIIAAKRPRLRRLAIQYQLIFEE